MGHHRGQNGTAGLDRGTILSAGQWIVVMGDSGSSSGEGGSMVARTGSTYDWDRLDSEPTPAARTGLSPSCVRLAVAGLIVLLLCACLTGALYILYLVRPSSFDYLV